MALTLEEALQKAIETHQSGQTQEAERLYSFVLNAQPNHPDANHNMGVLLAGVGKVQAALPLFKAALSVNPNKGRFWLSYINALVKLGRLGDAKQVLTQAKSKGFNGQAFKQLDKHFSEPSTNLQDPPSYQLDSIISFYTQGHLQQALSDATKLLDEYPNSAVLFNIAGASHAALMQFSEAIRCFRQSLKIHPDNAGTYNNIGNALRGKEDLKAAVESYKQALKIKPDYAEAYYNMGGALTDSGNSEAAIESYKQSIKINPNYAEAYANMGIVLLEKGDPEAAINSSKKALKIKPNFAEAYNTLGNALNTIGDLLAALDNYKQAVKVNPNYAEAFYNMGIALNDKGDLEAAINSYNKALKINPDYHEVHNNMGVTLNDKGDLEAAINSYNKALKIKPDYHEVHNNMGIALNDKGDPEAAINSYNKALKIKPHFAEAYNNMGNALIAIGESEAAINNYNKALKINPVFVEAYRGLSNSKRHKEYDESFFKMQSLCLDPNITDEHRCQLNFALGKVSEDLNEISQAFTYLKAGNELRKKILSYDIKQDIALFSQLKNSYQRIAKDALQSSDETREIKPIFIVGMPRSGTTLVEQIVSSHSEVTGAGELPYVEEFGQAIASGLIKPSSDAISGFRQRYIESLRKRSDDKSIVTDKMPWNFRYVGLIFSAFPGAKIIHVYRDPAATCWSNYKLYFAGKGSGYNNDLNDMVTFFYLYQDLMQFWQGLYGTRIFNLNYDGLTVNQENETRKLIYYLGLDWEDNCLLPHNNKRSVHTASDQQVRQKIYQGSSMQWRKFEPYLEGAFDRFSQLN